MNKETITETLSQIKSEFKFDESGKATVSIRGAARLAGISPSSLSRSFQAQAVQAVAQPRSQLSVFLTELGFDPDAQASWVELGIPDIALSLILEYYGYECQERYRSEQAKQCCRAYRAYGIRAWIQNQMGWKQGQIEQPKSQLEILQSAINSLIEQEKRVNQVEQRLDALENTRLEAKESLKTLPEATVEPPSLTTRVQLNRLVKDFAHTTGFSYQEVWRLLYREFRDRYHVDLLARARNSKPKHSALEICETLGMIEELYSIAKAILCR